MEEFVECGDSSQHGSENGDKSPHPTLGRLNNDQGINTLNKLRRKLKHIFYTVYLHPTGLGNLPCVTTKNFCAR